MKSNVTLFNFDGAYRKQNFYQNNQYEWIDYESMPNISLFCEKDSLRQIAEKINKLNLNGIYFLGSGNYHYMSYVLQAKIDKPYTLVLFDHHTDTLPSPSDNIISCGSWVLESLQHLPMLKKVFIIGVSEEAIHHIPDSIHNRVVLYTKNSLQSDLTTITKSIIKNISTESVYISMDKDVLNKKDALTGWDHGSLQLKQMMKMVKALIQYKDIIGVDVCGEYPINPANEYRDDTKLAVIKNNRTNGVILEYVKLWTRNAERRRKLLHA
jgi:arginase family enzyme